jgi:hypothetical protein
MKLKDEAMVGWLGGNFDPAALLRMDSSRPNDRGSCSMTEGHVRFEVRVLQRTISILLPHHFLIVSFSAPDGRPGGPGGYLFGLRGGPAGD